MMDDIQSAPLRRGLVLKEQGRYADAERHFREALGNNPHDAFALHQLAACQLQMPARQKEALQTIGQAIALEPNDSDHHVLKAFILCALDRPKEALKTAGEAVAADPFSAPAFMAEAQALLHLERWGDAEQRARKALALDADNSLAANQLAQALRLQNKMAENAEQIAGMLERDPEDADTHCSAGWAALQRGDHQQAGGHFREALRLDAESDTAREGLMQSFRARSPLYRGYLRYCFAMQRLSVGSRWAVIIGLYLGVKVLRSVFTGPYAPIGIGLAALYLLFVLWVWVARGVGNFMLLFDPFARYALRPNEKLEAWFVGGGVLAGAVFLGAGVAGVAPLLPLGIGLLAGAFPFAMTFTNDAPLGRWLFGAIGAVALAGGVLGALQVTFIGLATTVPGMPLLICGVVGAIASTWLGNIPALRR